MAAGSASAAPAHNRTETVRSYRRHDLARKKQAYRKPPVRSAQPAAPTEERVRRENPDAITVDGRVIDALPNAMFTVELENQHQVLSYLGGKMRKNYIRVLPG